MNKNRRRISVILMGLLATLLAWGGAGLANAEPNPSVNLDDFGFWIVSTDPDFGHCALSNSDDYYEGYVMLSSEDTANLSGQDAYITFDVYPETGLEITVGDYNFEDNIAYLSVVATSTKSGLFKITVQYGEQFLEQWIPFYTDTNSCTYPPVSFFTWEDRCKPTANSSDIVNGDIWLNIKSSPAINETYLRNLTSDIIVSIDDNSVNYEISYNQFYDDGEVIVALYDIEFTSSKEGTFLATVTFNGESDWNEFFFEKEGTECNIPLGIEDWGTWYPTPCEPRADTGEYWLLDIYVNVDEDQDLDELLSYFTLEESSGDPSVSIGTLEVVEPEPLGGSVIQVWLQAEITSTQAGVYWIEVTFNDPDNPDDNTFDLTFDDTDAVCDMDSSDIYIAGFTVEEETCRPLADGKERWVGTVGVAGDLMYWTEQELADYVQGFSYNGNVIPTLGEFKGYDSSPEMGTVWLYDIYYASTEVGPVTIFAVLSNADEVWDVWWGDIEFYDNKDGCTDPGTDPVPDPDQSTIVADPEELEVDEDSTITVTVLDTEGDPVEGAEVSFTATGGALSAPTCTTGSDGTCFVTLTSAVEADIDVTASIDEGEIGTATVKFTEPEVIDPGTEPSAIESSLSVDKDEALIGENIILTIEVLDDDGKPVPDIKVNISVDGGTLSATDCTTTANGKCPSITLTSDTAGTIEIAATLDESGEEITGSPTTVTFSEPPPVADPGASSVEVDETTRELDEAATITVTVFDTNGDPMADQVVSFTETGGTLSPTSCTTGADGTCQVELTNTDVGDVDVTASVAEGDIDTVTVTFIDTPVLDLMASTLAVDSDLWEVDQTATITATVVDTKGRAMSDQRVDFQIDSGVGDLSDDYCITGVDGKCTVTLTSDTPGDVEVSSSIDGDPMGNVTVTFTPERVPDPDESSMTLSTTTATVGGTVVITIEVKDEDGLPLAGKDVTLDADNGAVLSKTTCTSGADGTCTATLTTSTVGDVVVTATLATGQDITGSPETVTFNPPPPAVSISFKSRYVGETQTVTGTNFIPGETVTLVVTSDPWEVGDEVADANGNVSFDFVIPPSMAPASASETHTATLTGSTSGPYSGTFQVLAATTAAPGGKAAIPTGGTVSTATPLILLGLGLTLACAAVSLRRVGIDS